MSVTRSTLKEVAAEAGVTAGTVSRALRWDKRVNEETRLRIRKVADRLRYHPNLQARGLQNGRTGSIGLACATGPWILHHPYFAPMHTGFITAAAEEDMRVVCYVPPANGTLDLEAGNAWAAALSNGLVDGSVIYQAQDLSKQSIVRLQDRDLAVVLLNTDVEIPGFFQVLANTELRVRESVRWAAELGARRVGVLGLCEGMSALNAVIQRGAGSTGLKVSTRLQRIADRDPNRVESLDRAIDAMLSLKPDAVVFNEDFHVARFLRRQDSGGLPREIGLFAFGGTHNSSSFSFPRVHYLETDLFAAGRLAYTLFKDAQRRKAPRSEGLVWKRRGALP